MSSTKDQYKQRTPSERMHKNAKEKEILIANFFLYHFSDGVKLALFRIIFLKGKEL
jgi:hypothetical protein